MPGYNPSTAYKEFGAFPENRQGGGLGIGPQGGSLRECVNYQIPDDMNPETLEIQSGP
jgi:hypothetical protein